jgi:plastocyanin
MKHPRLLGLASALAVLTMLAGCSAPAPASSTPAGVVVSISDFAFTVPKSVAPGATITVVNADRDAHSVTSEQNGLFDVVVNGRSQKTFTAPDKPGSYPFFCKFHRYMQGTLVVE